MKFLNPEGRYEPRYEATLDEMFEAIEFVPYSEQPRSRQGWLFLSELRMNRGYTGGYHYVKFKPELIEMLAPSIYSNSPELLHQEMSCELIDWGDGVIRLYMQFARIIGAYCMAVVDEADVIAWLDRHKEAA